MNFGITGRSTPQTYQRCLPGSARNRPLTRINPITGEEVVYEPTTRPVEEKPKESKGINNSGIPSLNLNYLKDLDVPSGPIDICIDDYKLDTPGSASTVSWGSSRSMAFRPEGVPGLRLGGDDIPSTHNNVSARQKQKRPTAWDGDPIPNDLAPPSARYKEMYKEYEADMKKSYREHTNTNFNNNNQRDVNEAVERIQSARQTAKNHDDTLKTLLKEKEIRDDQEMNENWTKERYSKKQMLKKKDADELLEQNKRQKMVETVMIDQLSRAVISDPGQDDRTTNRPSSTRWTKGSNRYLHDSKISTSSTATENLLSKRVRFGARILTRNGRDAMKELTGFYFACDKTLTVYEFRQFGKSAKAMPFIYRGQYCHKSGPKHGMPYSLSDIYKGANLKISTEGQLALTDTLAECDILTLRVTDVDESAKEVILGEQDDVSERMHAPSKLDIQMKEYLFLIQDQVQDMIRKRGVRTVTGLGRYYRRLDQYKTGVLDQYDLEGGLKAFRINLNPETLEEVWDILDPEGMKLLDYGDYMHSVIGEMNEYRKSLVRKAFHKLDCKRKGTIDISDAKKFFNVNAKYKSSGGHEGISALQAFLEDVRENDKQDHISYMDFEEYYEGLSLGIQSHEDFANVLRNSWNI